MIMTGVYVIRGYVERLPATSGVYRMLGAKGEVLYVGKAKSLKKRVNSYTAVQKLPLRLQRMVAQTRSMEFIHTHTEVEALLLESNLIKELNPRYNILLRDDKSFPYIVIPAHHDFPQVLKHRGGKDKAGDYFGPFASAGMVNRTLLTIQKAFQLRNCTDGMFASRTRPCLQYHIKRCTAPCVGLVDRAEYGRQVDDARAFLSGESRKLLDDLGRRMQAHSQAMEFEQAAACRDKIRALQSLQAHQDINVPGVKDADVFALAYQGGQACVQVFFFRGGQNYGNRSYFPRHRPEDTGEEILSAMIAQFYQGKPVPREIMVSHEPEEKSLLEEALSVRAGGKVVIGSPVRGQRLRLIEFALKNAAEALVRHMAENATQARLLDGVKDLFGLEDRPARIEVYDNSHISGTNMVGGMIVAGPDGFIKKAYRKFNIRKAAASDDYGMMREVLGRRFKNPEEGELPDLVLIDGGQGQFGVAEEVLAEAGVLDRIVLIGIAKGPDRDAGREKFFMAGRPMFQLPERDPVLHYLQRLRDEAHRFAIGAHRTRRSMDISASPLDEIPGIGAKRKKALLLHFGSAKAVADAGLSDLEKVQGVSKAVAKKIYGHFRGV